MFRVGSPVSIVSTGGKLRHVSGKLHWCQDKVASGELEVRQIGTTKDISDIGTKPLSRSRLKLLLYWLQVCELFWLQMGDKGSHLGARLAVLRLRWSHLETNFVYLGAHNGDTTFGIAKSHLKIHLQNAVPSGPAAEQESTQQPPQNTKTPPKRSPQWPCKHDVTKDHQKMYLQNALPSGPAAQL